MKTLFSLICKITSASLIALVIVMLLSVGLEVKAQTVLIAPAGVGGFESGTTFAANGWSTALPGIARQWQVGTVATAAGGTRAAYVGSATAYNGANTSSVGHFYRDVVIPVGATSVYLNYRYRQTVIDNTYDYFYIFTTTTSYTPVSGTVPSTGFTQRYSNTASTFSSWTVMPQIDLTSLAGTTVRLVFTYVSDGVTPIGNPAVDMISLVYTPGASCSGTPNAGTASISASIGCASSNFTLSATGVSAGSGITYLWETSPNGAAPWTSTAGTSATFVTSTPTTAYYRLKTTCSSGGGINYSNIVSYTTTVCCTHTLQCYDSFGDGWNGGTVNLYVGGTLYGNYTVASGYGPTTVNFSAASGASIQVAIAAAGSYPGEMYINVIDGAGNTLVSNYYPNSSGTWNGMAYCAIPCSGTPSPGNTISTPSAACSGTNFTLSMSTTPAGIGISYQWQSADNIGFTTNLVNLGTASTQITSQTTPKYYRCQVYCSNSGQTGTSTPLLVNMNSFFNCYCIPASTYGNSSCFYGVISNVQLNTLNSNPACSSAPYYHQNAATGSNTTTVIPTNNYTLSVSSSMYNYTGVWIDWNQNGVFETTEFYNLGVNSAGVAWTGSQVITVPPTAIAGQTGMRVRTEYYGYTLGSGNACTTTTYGETEDYTITVAALATCSGTPNTPTVSINSASGCPNANFTLNSSGYSYGLGITYQWQMSPSNSPYVWTDITGANSISCITSTPTTAYYHLITTCTYSSLSSTSGPISYTVAPNACQCTAYGASNATYTGDDDIFNVSLGTLNNSSTCSTVAPGAGSVAAEYSNYTGFVAAPNLTVNNNYTLSVTVGMCLTSSYSGVVTAYIDYNQNGSFADAGELVYTSPYTSFAVGGTTVSTTITIPSDAPGGITRLRVIEVESSVGMAPTGTYSWGETEDYCVNITVPPPTISSFTPSGACSGTSVTITGTNFSAVTAVRFGGDRKSTRLNSSH